MPRAAFHSTLAMLILSKSGALFNVYLPFYIMQRMNQHFLIPNIHPYPNFHLEKPGDPLRIVYEVSCHYINLLKSLLNLLALVVSIPGIYTIFWAGL